jgi:glycogen synthase
VGSVERSKGVFDLIAITQKLAANHGIDVVVDVCGVGPALEAFKQAAHIYGERFVFHGWLARPELVARYHTANIVVVPTRRDIGEGMPQVCAEAALLGIPLVTSPLSNAGDDLADAMIEVPSEDIDAYVQAIAAIATDAALAERLARAGPVSAQGFVDRSKSYPAAIDAMLSAVFPGRVEKLESFDAIFERVF